MLGKMHGERGGGSRSKARFAVASFLVIEGLQFLMAQPASSSSSNQIYFFATREACEGSRKFSRPDCANAFANADAETQEMAPGFTTKFECERRFRLCQNRRSAPRLEGAELGRDAFSPVMLGVEISVEANRRTVMPVLAVVNPARMFHPRSLVRLEKPNERESYTSSQALLLDTVETPTALSPPDRSLREKLRSANSGGSAPPLDPVAEAERRERLKNAPFIE